MVYSLIRLVLPEAMEGELPMAHLIHSKRVATITELKRNPMAAVESGEGEVVVIMNRNEPAFYCVPVRAYEDLLRRIEDAENQKIP